MCREIAEEITKINGSSKKISMRLVGLMILV